MTETSPLMGSFLRIHKVMARILVDLDKCIPEMSPGGLGKLRDVLGGFDGLWGPHIAVEEGHFTADRVNSVAGIQEQLEVATKLEEHGRKHGGPGPLALPFLAYNLEGTDREAFLKPIPWVVKKVLVPVVWKRTWTPMRPFLLP